MQETFRFYVDPSPYGNVTKGTNEFTWTSFNDKLTVSVVKERGLYTWTTEWSTKEYCLEQKKPINIVETITHIYTPPETVCLRFVRKSEITHMRKCMLKKAARSKSATMKESLKKSAQKWLKKSKNVKLKPQPYRMRFFEDTDDFYVALTCTEEGWC